MRKQAGAEQTAEEDHLERDECREDGARADQLERGNALPQPREDRQNGVQIGTQVSTCTIGPELPAMMACIRKVTGSRIASSTGIR